jgi:hypothetical protein
MAKYKQPVIPEASTAAWSGLPVLETRRKMFSHYEVRYFEKAEIVNEHLGITVGFNRISMKKGCFGGRMYPKKACLVEVLDKLIQYAEYTCWGDRKVKDEPHVTGYLNFKVKVRIDGKQEHVHLVIRARNDGKFYCYSHEVNVW